MITNNVVEVEKYFIEVGMDQGFIYKSRAQDEETDVYLLEDELTGECSWIRLINRDSVLVEMEKHEYKKMINLYAAAPENMDSLMDYQADLIKKYC